MCVCERVSMCVSLLKHTDTSNSRARRSEGADAGRWNVCVCESEYVCVVIKTHRHLKFKGEEI
jgi:hypothetical protein